MDAAGGAVRGGGDVTRQSTIAGLDPLPAVVEAVRAAGVRLRHVRGSLVGECPACSRPTLYVGDVAFTCFGCGTTGGVEEAFALNRRAA